MVMLSERLKRRINSIPYQRTINTPLRDKQLEQIRNSSILQINPEMFLFLAEFICKTTTTLWRTRTSPPKYIKNAIIDVHKHHKVEYTTTDAMSTVRRRHEVGVEGYGAPHCPFPKTQCMTVSVRDALTLTRQ